LGLSLVAEVAARHRGGVALEPPRPGIGAVIVVTIPLSGS
jgi:signal transduction histidine kinase